MQFEIRHTDDGLMLTRLMRDGWNILSKPLGGGNYGSRCTGGWWLYKGDEAQARAEQVKRYESMRPSVESYSAQSWI